MRDGAEIQVVGSERQEAWHWPAVINFTLGGAGAGLYIVASIVGNPTHRGLAAMLVVAGFAVVALEAGRPLRAHHLWRNLRQSWMSREVLAAMIFISVSLLDSYRPSAVLATVSAASATALLLCHGFILYRARALPAWNVPIMPVLFITSGLAAGAGAALLVVQYKVLSSES